MASIDEVLKLAVVFNFIKLSAKEEDDILSGTAPLATFSARIRIAYAMGIISRKLRSDLDTLRKIRNDYAHKLVNMSLEDKDQETKIRGLNAAKHITQGEQLSVNEVLAKAVEKIELYLIMRTSPPKMSADLELLANLQYLDYSNFSEVKRRSHLEPYKAR